APVLPGRCRIVLPLPTAQSSHAGLPQIPVSAVMGTSCPVHFSPSSELRIVPSLETAQTPQPPLAQTETRSPAKAIPSFLSVQAIHTWLPLPRCATVPLVPTAHTLSPATAHTERKSTEDTSTSG